MVLDDISDYLTAQGAGTVSKDFSPPSADTVTCVYGTAGSAATFTMSGPEILQEPRVQVVCRSVSLQEAHQNARGVYTILNGVRGQVINGVRYDWIQALYEPVLIGRDSNARFLVACNYDIKKERST